MAGNDDLVGKKLGDYTVTRRLTKGGMSLIYLGVDEKLDRKAAIKILTPDLIDADESLSQRFIREARAVAALEHDNIVVLYQFGQIEEENLYFLAMRYIDGHDLADELRALRRRDILIGINRMLRILDQVAAALDFAHAAGIIHRDVKPSNILLDHSDKALLSDFGLVLRKAVDQTTGTAFGTPRYIAPEQATDSQLACAQSDIYSLAVIIFEMVTGQSLFNAPTPWEMALAHISEQPRVPSAVNPDVPPEVDKVILRSLQKDPNKRHRTARELVSDLRKAYKMGEPELLDTRQKKQQVLPGVSPAVPPTMVVPEKHMAESVKKHRQRISETSAATYRTITDRRRILTTPKMGVALVFGVIIVALIGILTPGGSGEAVTSATAELDRTPAPAEVTATQPVTVAETDSPTDTPVEPTLTTAPPDTPVEPATPIPVASGSGTAITLYDTLAFALRNSTDEAIDLNGLVFVRGDLETGDRFAASALPGTMITSGACLIIKSSSQTVALPDAWNCFSVEKEVRRPTENLFWRADGVNTQFRVYYNDAEIAVCEVASRGRNAQCELKW